MLQDRSKFGLRVPCEIAWHNIVCFQMPLSGRHITPHQGIEMVNVYLELQ